jgi:hypothetical protein
LLAPTTANNPATTPRPIITDKVSSLVQKQNPPGDFLYLSSRIISKPPSGISDCRSTGKDLTALFFQSTIGNPLNRQSKIGNPINRQSAMVNEAPWLP